MRHFKNIKKDMKSVMSNREDFNLLPDDSGSVWISLPSEEATQICLPNEPMRLSVPELECAYAHALATYGDLERYVDGIPAQVRHEGIKNLSGVEEVDVFISRWTAGLSAPAFYVCLDRAKKKIVLAVRGTLESADMITDVVSRPLKATFGAADASNPICGFVHSGIMEAAKHVFELSLPYLKKAIEANPGHPILVTGHSMGGGCAALLALMLRTHPELTAASRSSVRAVCLAPAAVMDEDLSKSCRGFVSSLVYNCDLVPRVNIQSVAAFVRETASLNPSRQLVRGIGTAFRWIMSCGSWTKKPISTNINLPPLFAPGFCLWIIKDKRDAAAKDTAKGKGRKGRRRETRMTSRMTISLSQQGTQSSKCKRSMLQLEKNSRTW